ncbi:hypothetical protein SDC9_70504 [bioreactor metagenome]|uniref:Uncharacterized protein n=1 Tax=bioreactor metagenome TaxID=1076179 RepID=A0A644Y772_9ZZZZ
MYGQLHARLQTLALAAADEHAVAFGLEDGGGPGAAVEFNGELAHRFRDGLADGGVVERAVVIRARAEAERGRHFVGRFARARGGEEHMAGARVHHADVHLRKRHLLLRRGHKA